MFCWSKDLVVVPTMSFHAFDLHNVDVWEPNSSTKFGFSFSLSLFFFFFFGVMFLHLEK